MTTPSVVNSWDASCLVVQTATSATRRSTDSCRRRDLRSHPGVGVQHQLHRDEGDNMTNKDDRVERLLDQLEIATSEEDVKLVEQKLGVIQSLDE